MSDYQKFEGTEKGQSFTLESNSRSSEQMAESLKPAEKAPEPVKEAAAPVEAPEAEDTLNVEGKQPKRPRDDPKARVAEATRNAAEAKRRIDEVERRAKAAEEALARFKSTSEASRAPEPPKPVQPNDRPKLDDYDSIEDHAEAMAKWVRKAERDAEQAERKAAEDRQKAEAFEKFREKRVTTFSEKMGKHLETDPDFWNRISPDVVQLRPLSVMDENEPKGPLNLLAEHFLTSDDPATLIQYFSDRPEEVTRFSQFTTEAQFWREVGKVETRVGSAATTASATTPEVSKAAPPARPVTGGPPSGTKALHELSLSELDKALKEDDRKRGKR